MAIRLHSSFAVHPGVWLRAEVIEPHGLTVSAAAEHLKVARQSMSALLNGRSGLSAEMAIRFEKAFGVSADTLLRMQAAHDMAQAREHADAIELSRSQGLPDNKVEGVVRRFWQGRSCCRQRHRGLPRPLAKAENIR